MRFLTEEEAKDWDAIAGKLDGINGLNDFDKARIKKAFGFLKREFGVDFLKKMDTSHPFNFNIHNYVADSRLWFAHLAENLNSIKSYPKYSYLLKRLLDSKKFLEAYSVLETACKFNKTGFDIEFDPSVIINNKNKEPDLKLINPITSESFFCEVSISNISEVQKKATKTEMDLFYTIIRQSGIEFTGKVLKSLSDNHKEEVADKIKIFSKNVIEELGFGELIIEGVLILGMATKGNIGKLEDWAKLQNCRLGSFEGPPIDVNEIHRMEFKIKKRAATVTTREAKYIDDI